MLPYTSNHPKEPPKIVIGEPCIVNPNSIEAVCCVMEHVQDVTHLNDEHRERKWTFLHSYCVPYVCTSDYSRSPA